MKKYYNKRLYVFDNDSDFEDFALNSEIFFEKTPSGCVTYNWDFTDEYKEAVKDGYTFEISDPRSLIKKRQAMSYKTITKKIPNIV